MSIIDEVKQHTDIEAVIGQYTTLKKAGRTLRALCPFHTEKTPSFFVYPDRQSWHCFGACATGGDVFSFVMKKEGIDFGEALRLLAEKAGVTIPSRLPPKTENDYEKDEKEKLYQINQSAAQYFHSQLLNSPAAEKARHYLTKRGVSAKTITDFQLGFSPNSREELKSHLIEKGYTESELVNAGIAVASEDGKTHDRFHGKLMFPIQDERGHVTGFGARVLDNSLPKYINSPQTPVFDKSGSLYGINLASSTIRQQNMAVIVEGYMDVIIAHQYGFANVVASMGTAITDKHMDKLRKLTRNVILALDPDAAGEKATERGGETAITPVLENSSAGIDNLPELSNEGEIRTRRIFGPNYANQKVINTDVAVLILPDKKDPDEVIKENPQSWQVMINNAVPVLDYIFNSVTSKVDLNTAKGKSTVVESLLPIVRKINDPVHYNHYKQTLARLVNINPRDLDGVLKEKLPPSIKRYAPEGNQQKVARTLGPILSNPREEYCLALLLRHPELKEQSECPLPEYFDNSENREIFLALKQANDLDSLRDKLDEAIWDHLEAIASKDIPEGRIEQKYIDCILSLRKKFLQNLEIKRSDVLLSEREMGGTVAELAKQEEQGTEVKTKLLEAFIRKSSRG